MKNNLSLAVVVPAYNEESTISSVIQNLNYSIQLINEISYFEVVIVNDGSSDKTEKIASGKKKHSCFKSWL